MILVILGTEKFAFDRLVREVDRLTQDGAFEGETVFVQLGSSTYEPTACEWERLIPYGEMYERVRDARLVISHAGAGTLLLCSQLGTPQIVIPRRAERGEHLDDHQVEFAERMHQLGRVHRVMELDRLEEAIQVVGRGGVAGPQGLDGPSLPDELDQLMREWGLG